MTRDEILNMPAGRETDILVARKVLGHVVQQDTSGEWWEGFTTVAMYSTLTEYAINLAEHLHLSKDAFFTLNIRGRQVMAEFEIDTVRYFAFSESIPLAICRAALLAVEAV